MKAMIYGNGSGKKPTYAKYHRYATEADMPEVGEDWEIAVISAEKPLNDKVYIGVEMPKVVTTTAGNKFAVVWIATDIAATTRGEVAADVYVPMQKAVKITTYGANGILPAHLYVPKSSGGVVDGVSMKVGWNPLGRHLFTSEWIDPIGCTLDMTYTETGYELYSTGNVAAGSSRIYTTASELKSGGTVFSYSNMHATVSLDESYDGTRVRLGVVKTQSYKGGNPATSKYTVYQDFEVTAGKDMELSLPLDSYKDDTAAIYAAFGVYNAGSTTINMPLRVKRWWLE